MERSNERAERMSKLKEVAIGQHTQDDVRSAVAKLTEVNAHPAHHMFGRVGNWCSLCLVFHQLGGRGLSPVRARRKDTCSLELNHDSDMPLL